MYRRDVSFYATFVLVVIVHVALIAWILFFGFAQCQRPMSASAAGKPLLNETSSPDEPHILNLNLADRVTKVPDNALAQTQPRTVDDDPASRLVLPIPPRTEIEPAPKPKVEETPKPAPKEEPKITKKPEPKLPPKKEEPKVVETPKPKPEPAPKKAEPKVVETPKPKPKSTPKKEEPKVVEKPKPKPEPAPKKPESKVVETPKPKPKPAPKKAEPKVVETPKPKPEPAPTKVEPKVVQEPEPLPEPRIVKKAKPATEAPVQPVKKAKVVSATPVVKPRVVGDGNASSGEGGDARIVPAKPSTRSGSGSTNEPSVVDMRAYRKSIEQTVTARLSVPKGIATGAQPEVLVKISRSGKIVYARLSQSSGNSQIDRAAIEAVRIGSTLLPLPSGYQKDTYEVPIKFQID